MWIVGTVTSFSVVNVCVCVWMGVGLGVAQSRTDRNPLAPASALVLAHPKDGGFCRRLSAGRPSAITCASSWYE